MTSAVPPPRQLAPTVGPAAVLAGVVIRTGNFINTGERVVSGLVQRFGLCDYVRDNAGSFRGKTPPRNGIFIGLGEHRVYIGVDITDIYPHQVVVAGEPPRSAASCPPGEHLAGSVEVMVAAGTQAGAALAGSSREPAAGAQGPPKQITLQTAEVIPPETNPAELHDTTPKAPRVRGPPLERPENILQATIENLTTPVAPILDPANAQAELEETRQKVLVEAKKVSALRESLNRTLREYAKANKLDIAPERVDELRLRGKNLMNDINKEHEAHRAESGDLGLPRYSTPAKNLRAANAAALELEGLTGEARQKQQERVNELVRIANQQNEEMHRADPARPGASRMVHSAGAAPALSVAAASSPGNNARRDRAVTSGKRNKQIVPYDPAIAGKSNENRGNGSRGNSGERNPGRAEKGGGSRGNGDLGRAELGRGNHENNIPVEVRREPPLNPQPRHEPRQEREARPARHIQVNERYNDGYSEMKYAIHGGNNHYGMQDRVLYRDLPSNDARLKLDRLYRSELLEEQGPPGPTCFGPRIMGEPPVPNF